MLGMSFGEMVILAVVALVVVGPRNLPTLMRQAGRWIGKLRRMAIEMRAESGIDEMIDAEGLRDELANFRNLSAGGIALDQLNALTSADASSLMGGLKVKQPSREREYPTLGCDSYGAIAEDLAPYTPGLAALPAHAAPPPPPAPAPVSAGGSEPK